MWNMGKRSRNIADLWCRFFYGKQVKKNFIMYLYSIHCHIGLSFLWVVICFCTTIIRIFFRRVRIIIIIIMNVICKPNKIKYLYSWVHIKSTMEKNRSYLFCSVHKIAKLQKESTLFKVFRLLENALLFIWFESVLWTLIYTLSRLKLLNFQTNNNWFWNSGCWNISCSFGRNLKHKQFWKRFEVLVFPKGLRRWYLTRLFHFFPRV